VLCEHTTPAGSSHGPVTSTDACKLGAYSFCCFGLMGEYMSVLTHRSGDGAEGNLEAVLSAARSVAAEIAVIADAAQTIMSVSASFTAMTGYEPAELLGRNCRMLQGPGTDESTTRQIREVLASGQVFEGQMLNYRKDGSAFWAALKITPMRVGGGDGITHYVSVQRDITNSVALLKQLEVQALQDHLTGLPNRAAAEQALLEAVRHGPQDRWTAAVCLIDLDDFRMVNNTFGHASGDKLLQQWSARMLSRLREGDMLARMGGDEFLLVLGNIIRDTVNEDLPGILARIHEAVEEPFTVNGQQIRIGMSMGIGLVPEDGSDSASILRNADEALYLVKKRSAGTEWWGTSGDGHTHVREDGTVSSLSDKHDLEDKPTAEDYRKAVRAGNAVIHLQPVVDLRQGAIHFAEALARLELPGGHIAYPDEFLPHLGADDQRRLFDAVLDQALTVLESWDKQGTHRSVTVNLPPEILQDRALPALITQLLHKHGILPGRLALELLESQTMDLETQRVALQDLVDLGVVLAMDDLGSGYSSLQRLSSFPFHAIKLDRGLFLQVRENPLNTLSVMATLIQMGRDLDMDVVIEGLENESLTEAALILGAPHGQGYYFARPMLPEDCLEWIRSFAFPLRDSPLRTPLGALAYHWNFARLAAPHPLAVNQCPLTQFFRTMNAGPDLESWHARQHTTQSVNPVASRLLIDWLTDHIRTSIEIAQNLTIPARTALLGEPSPHPG
jgi:diguanylate cyclase (GGDEF)-like protein/PAS domain S-box-containing protein